MLSDGLGKIALNMEASQSTPTPTPPFSRDEELPS